MANLQDIINLAEADGGKFFVIDETGEAKLVIMQVEEYQKLLLGKLERQVKQQISDIELINRKIIEAQLKEDEKNIQQKNLEQGPGSFEAGESVGFKRPGPKPADLPIVKMQDLRAEVIDPSFDFEGPRQGLEDF